MAPLSGLSAFPLTPSDTSGVVETRALRQVVKRLVEAKVDSVGLLGSTGTYAYLSRQERRRALDAALIETGGNIPVVVGVGALRTDETVRLAQDARAAGAAAGLLAPVSYTPLTEDEVFEHVAAVTSASGLPICIYDNPSTTHFTFTPSLIGRLSRVDGVIGVKTGARTAPEVGQQLKTLRDLCRPGFSLGFSVDLHAHEGLLAGADAWYSVVGGTLPRAAVALTRAAQSGNVHETRRLHDALEPLWSCFRVHTSLRVMYVIADILGLGVGEPPRPILPLRGKVREDVAAAWVALPSNLQG